MAERIKPSVSYEDVGRLASRPDNHDRPVSHDAVTMRLPQDSELGKRRQRGEINDGFGAPQIVTSFSGLDMSVRSKPAPGGEHRRYYIGAVQFAFVRKEKGAFIIHLTGQDDAPTGTERQTEAQVLDYLRAQLVLG